MNILIQLGHPAHFHLYRNTIKNLKNDGHNVYILIKTKDILEQLLQEAGLPYVNIYPSIRKNSKFAIIKAVAIRLWRIAKFTISHHIDLLTGSSTEIAQIGWLLRRHSVILGEDDAAIVPEFVTLAKPVMDSYLTPFACNMGDIEDRVIKYHGYQKLAYLHPNYFIPDRNVAAKYVEVDKPFFILRFTKLRAYHDLHAAATGITSEVAQHIIKMLEPYGKIYITSERELEHEFEKYRLIINPLDIHHLLSYCSLYIGDSQSMAVESALLGVPNIRFNDFVGKIGVLDELENKYRLTIGIPASNPEMLYGQIDDMLGMKDLKKEYRNRRKAMLDNVIDVTAFFTWFFENYPESRKIMRENPNYQLNFK